MVNRGTYLIRKYPFFWYVIVVLIFVEFQAVFQNTLNPCGFDPWLWNFLIYKDLLYHLKAVIFLNLEIHKKGNFFIRYTLNILNNYFNFYVVLSTGTLSIAFSAANFVYILREEYIFAMTKFFCKY